MFQKYDLAVKMFTENAEANELSAETIGSYSRSFKYYRSFLEENGFEEACIAATAQWKIALSKNVSITSADLYLHHLSYLSAFATEMQIFSEPFMSDKLFPSRKALKKERDAEYEHVLTKEDASALIYAEKAVFSRTPHTFLREKAVVTLTIMSGLRNIELRNLALSDLNFEQGYIYARVTKGDKPRYVPFPEVAQNAVNAYLNSGLRPSDVSNSNFLFGVVTRTGEWRQFARTELSELIYKYEKSIIGEEKASRSHALRHCFASVCVTDGVDMNSISRILGHADTRITARIYAKDLAPENFASNMGLQVSSVFNRKEGCA